MKFIFKAEMQVCVPVEVEAESAEEAAELAFKKIEQKCLNTDEMEIEEESISLLTS